MKEVNLNGKIIVVKELKYKDVVSFGNKPQEESVRELLKASAGITDEEYNDLSMKDGIELQKVVNEVNGFDSFSQK
jgi:hypothetical protein